MNESIHSIPSVGGPPSSNPAKRVLVTGASGYIGGRLVHALLERGYAVRCVARSPRKLQRHHWSDDPRVEIVEGDLNDHGQLPSLLSGCGPAYYLVHSMVSAGDDYEEQDRRMAQGFAKAAATSGTERIIYLGGLGEMGENLSRHLQSRREVEHLLASGPTPVTVLRAAMIIGSGSASFEILRYLVERLPIMVTPKWVRTECQPIAIRNVLHYLVTCLETPATAGKTLDIGSPDVMSYQKIMDVMAEELELPRRVVIPVPVLTPRLSSAWIHLVTPVSASLARPLADGLRNRVVCRNDEAARLMPQELLGVRDSIRLALSKERSHEVETVWSTAGPIPGDPDWAGGKVFVDQRSIDVDAPPEVVYRAVLRIGGGNGYYAADWLWRIRGVMDRLVGGPGLRRGRRDPETVDYGEALDFWRVNAIERDRHLGLRAEMKLPGEALLEFDLAERSADPEATNTGQDDHANSATPRTRLTQTARFRPKGLFGLVYWFAVLPLHGIVFSGMLRGIQKSAESDGTA